MFATNALSLLPVDGRPLPSSLWPGAGRQTIISGAFGNSVPWKHTPRSRDNLHTNPQSGYSYDDSVSCQMQLRVSMLSGQNLTFGPRLKL